MNPRNLIVAILAGLWLALPASAAAPTVTLGNGVLEVPVGQTAPLPISVKDVQDLYGVEIHLRFDPALVQVADADSSTDGVQILLGDFLSADFVAQNRADNQGGTIDFAVTQLNPSEPKSGSGTLCTIQFQGVGAGQTGQLNVVDKTLTTRDGEVIPATAASVEIKVKGAAATGTTSSPSSTPASPQARPSASITPERLVRNDAPTATRAFTSTPGPAASDGSSSAQSSATPYPTPAPPSATATESPIVATATRPQEMSAPETPAAPEAPTGAPSQSAPQTPRRGSTAETTPPTPALVAKASSGSSGQAILGPGDLEKPAGSEQQRTQPTPPACSGLLFGGGALLGLAALLAGVLLLLVVRWRRA